MNVLITGATGFIGTELLNYFLQKSCSVSIITRSGCCVAPGIVKQFVVRDFNAATDFSGVFKGIDVVVHLAAEAHIKDKRQRDNIFEVNALGTLNFAKQASESGVCRFVFISTIGVNGNQTFSKAFSADDVPCPVDDYAMSKLQAEIGLKQLASQSKLDVVIIRPPMVYGGRAPGKFKQLVRAVKSRLPLPLGGIHSNGRSLVAIENLIDFIACCVSHPSAANEVFLVADQEVLSTKDLVFRLKKHLRGSCLLVPLPSKLLMFMLVVLRKKNLAISLCGSLEVDIEKNYRVLGWRPLISIDSALKKTALILDSNYN